MTEQRTGDVAWRFGHRHGTADRAPGYAMMVPPVEEGRMSGTARQLMLVGAAIAVGAAILAWGLDTSGSLATAPEPTPTPTVVEPTPASTPAPAVERDPASVTVLVANSVGVAGLAGATTETVTTGLGFTALTPVDSTAEALEQTAIHFVDGYATEAEQVRTILRLGAGATVSAMPASPPVADLGGAHLLVVVGNDLVPQ